MWEAAMPWWSRLLRKRKADPIAGSDNGQVAYKYLVAGDLQSATGPLKWHVLETLADALQKAAQGSTKATLEWMDSFFATIISNHSEEIASYAIANLALSLKDNQRHSTAIGRLGTWFNISTFPTSIRKAPARFFSHGYLNDLNALMGAKLKLGLSRESHFVHAMFFAGDGKVRMLLTLYPNKDQMSCPPIYILPTELLTAKAAAAGFESAGFP